MKDIKKILSLLMIVCLLTSYMPMAWAVVYTGEDEYEPHDSFNMAYELQFGVPVEGTLAGGSSKGSVYNSNDYFRFQLSGNGQIHVNFNVINDSNDFGISLFDSSNEVLAACGKYYDNSNVFGCSFRKRLASGTYYIRVVAGGLSSSDIDYSLLVNFTNESGGNYESEPNNSFEDANSLMLNAPIIGGVDLTYYDHYPYYNFSKDDWDYYVFTTEKKQEITIEYNFSKGIPDHNMYLYEKVRSGNNEIKSWSMNNRPYPFTAKETLAAGTYYIRVTGTSSANRTDDYTLTVKSAPEKTTEPEKPVVTEPVEEPTEEPIDEPIDKPIDKPKDEPTGEPKENPVVTNSEDKPAVDEPVEEHNDNTPTSIPEILPSSGTSIGASEWAVEQIDEAISLGLIPDDLLTDYKANITRAEFCRMSVRMLMAKCGLLGNEDRLIEAFGIDMGSQPFTDTSDSYIAMAYALRIVNGTGNGKFTPDGLITRQEAATMLKNAAAVFEFTEYSDPPVEFDDKGSISIWAITGVNFVSANGIMNGTGNNKFSPFDRYTREQAILTMLRLFKAFPRDYYSI